MAQQAGARSSSIASPPIPSHKVPITGEELLAMGDIGRVELVKGEVVPMSPTGHAHGFIEVNFAAVLHAFVHQRKLGRVLGGEVGIYTHRNPDTVRGADVAFISNERLAQVQSTGYLDVAPELIVEVMSPDDRWGEVNDKLVEYFAVGVQLVWVADPRRQQILVYRSRTEIDILAVDDTLTGGKHLPGFSIAVTDIFDPS